MKKGFIVVLGFLVLSLGAVSQSEAGVRVGVGIGFGPVYGFSHRCYRGPAYYPYAYAPVVYPGDCYPRTVVVRQEVVRAPRYEEVQEISETSSPRPIPYGFVSRSGEVQSPWSDFVVRQGGKSPGQVVYDVNNGKPFRIP